MNNELGSFFLDRFVRQLSRGQTGHLNLHNIASVLITWNPITWLSFSRVGFLPPSRFCGKEGEGTPFTKIKTFAKSFSAIFRFWNSFSRQRCSRRNKTSIFSRKRKEKLLMIQKWRRKTSWLEIVLAGMYRTNSGWAMLTKSLVKCRSVGEEKKSL